MKTLYILSDSTGVGQFVTLHKTWAHLLSKHLEGRYIVQNLSRNGETSRQALERLVPDVLRYEPDIVYVQYGTNDSNCWETDRGVPRVAPRPFEANMYELIMRCHLFMSYVILGNNHTGAYNEHIEEVFNKSLGISLVDHSHYTGDYMLDDVHLNEYGHQLYFESIAKVIP